MPHQKLVLPDDHTFQDVQLQLLLLTLAYARALQYWVEKVICQHWTLIALWQ